MKKLIILIFGLISFVGLSSLDYHKFYVSIYQINFNQKDKRLEITSRIFIDDLNNMLFLKYNKKTHISEKEETKEDIELMKKYVSENFLIKVNGVSKPINYLSYELEANVLICYFNIKDISKIKSLEVQNTALFELNLEQQNIIQTTIYNIKKSLLLTPNNTKDTIKVE